MIPFAREARFYFDTIADKFGMACVRAGEHQIRYESPSVFLSIRYDNGRSYEIMVEIGQKVPGQPERPFSLAEILRLNSLPEAGRIDGLAVWKAENLSPDLQELAALVMSHAVDFLRGDQRAFELVAQLRYEESVRYAVERDLRTARARAEDAWKANDFDAVVNALTPVAANLTQSEKKRLDYALAKSAH